MFRAWAEATSPWAPQGVSGQNPRDAPRPCALTREGLPRRTVPKPFPTGGGTPARQPLPPSGLQGRTCRAQTGSGRARRWVSHLVASLAHTGRRSVVLGHKLNIQTTTKTYKKSHHVLSKFTVLRGATFIAILGRMGPVGRRSDPPGRAPEGLSPPPRHRFRKG